MGETRKVTIESTVYTPNETWRSKEDIAALEQASLKFWNEQTDEQRQAVIVIVRDGLLRLLEEPDLWIPTSLKLVSNTRVDLFINLHFAEIDEEVVRRRVQTERELHNTREDLVSLHEQLGHVAPQE